MSTKLPAINLSKLETIFAQLERKGVAYGLGAKFDLDTEPDDVPAGAKIDCSGFVRWILHHASGKQLILPDGSQNQREYMEAAGIKSVARYQDENTYMTTTRLFINFIKPNTNGCGKVGHVWLTGQFDFDRNAETMESYGGNGVGSRPWNARVLSREWYSGYELPTTKA